MAEHRESFVAIEIDFVFFSLEAGDGSRRGNMGWVNLIELVRDNPPTEKEVEQVLEYRRRKAKARFYADENFPALAVEVLKKMGGKVVTVQRVGHRGHPDENHAAYALKHGYILLTCDRDYLDESRFPLIHCPAIVVFDFGSASRREEIQQSFTCLKRVLRSPQFFDKWTKIDAKRDSWTEFSRHLACIIHEGLSESRCGVKTKS
jgi:predicted nuclease of predicted toxin-antitoxin system